MAKETDAMSPYERVRHQTNMEAAAMVYAEADAGLHRYCVLRMSARRYAILKRMSLSMGSEKSEHYLTWELYREKLSWVEAQKLVRELNKEDGR